MPIAGENIQNIPIPEGTTVTVGDKGQITVNGPEGELMRTLYHTRIEIAVKGENVVLTCTLPRKAENALLGTFRSHITNMILGVTKGFEYKMKIVYSHFPVKVSVKETEFVIENFLGEKFPRKAKIIGETKIVSKGDEVVLTGANKEHVGQSAANIERATKIKGYDPRVFQDGIYIVSKGVIS
jgi:large subunit ribosomal protein L6